MMFSFLVQAVQIATTTFTEPAASAPRHVMPMPLESAGSWINAVAALGFVVLLLLACSWGLQRLQRRGLFGLRAAPADPAARLALVQNLPIDAKTRLVLVRRGAVAHLLCLHAQGALLVESGIAMEAGTSRGPITPDAEDGDGGNNPPQIIFKEPLT